jgi:hypothetical protein
MPNVNPGATPGAFVERIEKPWGCEVLLTPTDLPYAAKILHISEGRRLSLQRHTEKTETVVLLSGDATLILEIDCTVSSHGRTA